MLAACAGGSSGAPRAAPAWTLSAEPTLTIGSDSVPEQLFGRISGVVTLDDGHIAVLDGSAMEIRLFGSDGGYRRTIARRGRGPGEFTAVDWIQRHGDSLLVNDVMRGDVTLLGTDGTVHRAVTAGADSTYRFIGLMTRLPSGRWLASSTVPRGGPRVTGLNQDTLVIGLLSTTASGPFRPVARIPGMSLMLVEGQGAAPARFRQGGIVVPLGGRIAVIHPDSGSVRFLSEEGAEGPSSTLLIERQPLTAAMVSEALARELADITIEQARAFWEALYATEPKPSHLPMARAAFADGDRLLWLEEFWLDPDAPRRYHIVRDDGAVIGVLGAPAGFRLSEIGPDWILGVQEDADGVQRVVRYRLVRR